MSQRNILFVDMPCYAVPLASPYRDLLARRLKAQSVISKQRTGFELHRPGLPYSRGLLLLATYTEQKGHHVQYLIYSDPNDAKKFSDLCKDADVIGFTAMTPVVQQVYALCQQAKVLNPSVLCVLGGPHANVMAEQCLQECPALDVVIPAEAMIPFEQLVDHLDAYKDTDGIICRQTGHVITHNPLPYDKRLITIAEIPEPAHHLLNRHISAYAHNIRTFSGCPYQCDFCIERLSWRGRRGHNSLQRVIDEICIVAQGSTPGTLIHFSDSVFTLDKERTLELCYLLAKAQLDVVFSCDTRIDHVDADIVKALAHARFVTIRLGIEDLDDDILSVINKNITADQTLQTLDIIRHAAPNMNILAYMITGLPGSTIDTLFQAARTISKLILQKKVDIIGNKVLVPYPGTPYFQAPEQHHMEILHHNWSKFDRLSFPVYRMADLTEYEIYYGFLMLESVQLQAYEARIGNSSFIDLALPESLDYVYRSYVQQVGLLDLNK
jgi:anaerobic magnesium-protoporphyrin IX monomethyl ester cyclase